MSSNFTANYNLSQWERTDKIQMEDFNADNAKIDAVLGTLASAVAGHGNCRVEILSAYDANKEDTPVTIRFSARPVAFFMMSDVAVVHWGRGMAYAVGPCYGPYRTSLISKELTWSGNTATTTRICPDSPSAKTYIIVAFYAEDGK